MKKTLSDIDIKENALRRAGNLLDILLLDRTTNQNIIWATESYEYLGTGFKASKNIKDELVTGGYGRLIQPRAAKNIVEQRKRTKDKAEVFTPLKTIEHMNKTVDQSGIIPNQNNWQEYIKQIKLEITCGEAPFIVTRYNPTANTGKLIKINHRVGFLDRKLKIVTKYCQDKKNWLFWAKEAFKASYGYEWQGDNILLARENLLYTFIDYYVDKFNRRPSLKDQEEIAEIISWNIFQMDGLKYVIPMSCVVGREFQPALLPDASDQVKISICEGCKQNRADLHSGIYTKVMNWEIGKVERFVDLVSRK